MIGRHAAILLVGLACTKAAEPPEVTQPQGSNSPAPDASKGPQVKSYIQADVVDAVALKQAAAIDDFAGTMLAFAPDGRTWATAWGSGARLFQGDQERASARLNPHAATAIGFSADGAALHVGMDVLDAATGVAIPQPAPADLAAWAAAAGQPAPSSLGVAASRTSDDGSLIVVAATGVIRDRRTGLHDPKTGDVDWVIALDGATRKPTDVLWHGKGVHKAIAISARHVAVGGQEPAKVFDRAAITKAIELGGSPRGINALVWSPDGELLAAVAADTVVVWRTGTWDQPASTWKVGSQYHSSLAYHPTRPVLVVGNRDGHVRCYGVADAQLSSPPLVLDHDAGGEVRAVALSPDGATLLAIASSTKNQVLRFDVTLTP